MKNTLRLLCVVALACSSCLATNFSFSGGFTYDTDVQLFSFTLNDPTPNISFLTWSYSGGTNAAGTVIPNGGFEPILSLWRADGGAMNPGNSGACAGTPLTPDPVSGVCGDIYYPTELSFPGGVWDPGTYIIGLSTFVNPAAGDLADGYLLAQQGFDVPGNYSCSSAYQGNPPSIPEDSPFCDRLSFPIVQRTGVWALDIINVDEAHEIGEETPEPATLGIAFLGCAVLLAASRRRLRA